MEAVRNLWLQDTALAALFPQPIESGRLRPGPANNSKPFPYASLDVKFFSQELVGTGGAWHDHRTVTIAAYGTKEQVANILSTLRRRFNRDTVLAYPSRARFIRWWPLDGGRMEEDDTTREGQDVWVGTIQADVWSIREDGQPVSPAGSSSGSGGGGASEETSVLLLGDYFLDPDGTLLTAAVRSAGFSWTANIPGSGWDAQAGKGSCNGGGFYTAAAPSGRSNYRITCKNPDGHDLRIIGRYVNATNYWYADLRATNGGEIYIVEVNGGVELQRGYELGVGFAAGDTLYAEFRDTSIKAGRNGVERASCTSGVHLTGNRVGFEALGAWMFDDYEVWS